jgi:MbtH protein
MQNSSKMCRGPKAEGTNEEEDDGRRYVVIFNHEEQYSIWPSQRLIPAGWRNVGNDGSRLECLEYVETVWTDMRPLSVRKRMNKSSRAIQRG